VFPRIEHEPSSYIALLSILLGARARAVCSVVSCGAGGACKAGGAPFSFSYSCECRPGYANLLNLTTLPCVNCMMT
jgi:hypothetical protein